MYIHISIKISLCNHLCLYYIKHEFKLISPTTSPHWSFKAISPCSPENFHFNKEMPGSTICHPQTHLFSSSGFRIVNLYTYGNNSVNQSEMLVCLWFCRLHGFPELPGWLNGKYLDAGKDWRQKEKGATEDEMVGWHHWLNRHEFAQTLGDSKGQRSLPCCSPWGPKSQTWLSDWTTITEAAQLMIYWSNSIVQEQL